MSKWPLVCHTKKWPLSPGAKGHFLVALRVIFGRFWKQILFWRISTNLGACFLLHWWWHQDGFGFSFNLNLWDYFRLSQLSLFDVMMNPSFSIYSLLYNDFVIHMMKVIMNLNRILNMVYWSLLGQTAVEALWFASFAVGSAGDKKQEEFECLEMWWTGFIWYVTSFSQGCFLDEWYISNETWQRMDKGSEKIEWSGYYIILILYCW